MNILSEVHTVEETKHLVPNLESFSKAVFGNDSFFLDWQSEHVDWAIGKLKRCDGLVWLPWKSQLWLTEVEWKESSNFFDQSRAFARSKVDIRKFEDMLKKLIQPLEHNLNPFFGAKVRGEGVMSSIVEQTLENHIQDKHLEPHAWVLLGHDGTNTNTLRENYVREVKARFTGKQHYIVTMARMFTNDFSTFFLLEHTYSGNYIPKTTLVQGRINTEALSFPLAHPNAPKTDRPLLQANIKPEPPKGSRAEKIFTLLSNSSPETKIDNLRLRITLPGETPTDFKIDWSHKGKEFLVIGKEGISKKPANALKAYFGKRIPAKMQNVCLKYGSFYDISVTPPKLIARYARIANALSKGIWQLPDERPLSAYKTTFFFEEIDAHKQKSILKQIVKRRRLWEAFIAKGIMSKSEFEELSHFKHKGITGFLLFLTYNGIATRTFDDFTLDERAIPYIRKILDDYSEAT